MKEVLRRLGVSRKHLDIIDDFMLKNDREYKRMEKELKQMGDDTLIFVVSYTSEDLNQEEIHQKVHVR